MSPVLSPAGRIEEAPGRRGWRCAVAAAAVSIVALASLAEPVEIKPKFELGDSYQQRLVMDQNIEQTVMGNPMNISMAMEFDLTTTVEAKPADGVHTLRMKYDRVEAEVNGPMGPGAWKSGDAVPQNPMLVGFAAMDGMELSYDLSEQGDVTNLEGTDALMEKALSGVPEGMRPQMRAMFEGQFGEEQMASMIKAGHAMYPGKPVEVGDSWDQSMELGGMMPLVVEATYNLAESDGDSATTNMSGTLKTGDDAMMEVAPGMEAEMVMDGQQDGTVVFDLETGWVRSMNVEQTIKGELTMMNPGNPGGPPMVIPMNITSTIELETLE